MPKAVCLIHIIVALVVLLGGHVLGEGLGRTTRQLQQRGEEITITRQNIRRLGELVADANRNAIFVFAEDVRLPSVIEVNTPRLTFRGGGPNVRPSLTCADNEEGFTIHANNIKVENLILRNCTRSAMRVFDKASICEDPFDPECQPRPSQRLDITLTNVDFIDNIGTEELSTSGGFSAEEQVSAKIHNCRFERNTGISGGAIVFAGSSLHIENCSFIANVAVNTGGAIFAMQHKEAEAEQLEAQFIIVNSEFDGNSVLRGGRDRSELTLSSGIDLETNPYLVIPLPSPSGGAIYITDYAEVSFEDCRFVSNQAVPAGGAIHISDNQQITVKKCTFEDNSVKPPQDSTVGVDLQLGGAIFAAFSETTSRLSIEECSFSNNTAIYGGALHYVAPIEAAFGINDCEFTNNRASLGGGAIVFRNAAAPEVKQTDFKNNSAFVGGAIFVTNGAGLTLSRAISDNRASRFEENVAFDGGAVFGMGSGNIRIDRTFYTENKAERNGGAVCFIDSKAGSELRIEQARMYNNSAEKGGAMYVESVAAVLITSGATDRNAVVLGISDPPRSEFFENSAVCGGAIYYKASNLIQNTFLMNIGNFSGNMAHSNISSIFPEPLNYPNVANRSTRLFFEGAVKDEAPITSDANLLDPLSANPCHPGGGGAICMVLSGLSDRAPASIRIIRSSFKRNAATVGGAMMILTEENIDWKSDCPSSRDRTATLLTSDPCRNLNLRALTFKRNRAQAAGGALMISNLKHVYYSDVTEENKDFNYQTMDKVRNRDNFIENRVGEGGYGKDIAGMAVRLNIRRPIPDAATGILITNQSSGQAHALPSIEIQVLDGLDQVVSDGILDASLGVGVDAVRQDSNGSIAAGQVVSTASKGVAVFDALTLSAFPGQYEIGFSVRGKRVEVVNANVTLRECHLGERYNTDGFVCEACAFESFTFYVNVSRCTDCPDNARCAGNASLIPASGYWHSSPFSVIIHECFHNDACAYENRQEFLEEIRSTRIQEFLDRFDQQDEPVFTNEEYSQCSTGYEGPLCGSCSDGYGHTDGKTCVECSSKSTTATVIFLLGLWQLIFMTITIRSALVSIRDMNQMMAIARQQALFAAAPARSNTTRRPSSTFMVPQQNSTATNAASTSRPVSGDMPRTEIEEQFARSMSMGPATTFVSSFPLPVQVSPKQQYSADYIIAAQHVSETIKIFVNFFQVTSIAVNINLEWTTSIKNMLAGMNSVAGFSNGATFTPMTCLLDTDSDTRSVYGVVLRVAFPLFLMLLVMCLFVAQWLVMRRNPTTTRFVCQQFIRSRLIICFLVVGFFAYQSISEDLMGTVSCIRLDSEDMSEAEKFDNPERNVRYSHFSIANGYYWTEDTSIKCFSRNHAFLVGFLGIPGIVLFLCGVPLYLLIFLLYKRHKNQLMELQVLNTYGFIYQNYEDKFVYWEVIILFRKALIGAIVVFAYPLGANLQGVMALGVLILALAIHLIAAPFKYIPLNALEGCSLVVSIFTFYAGVVFNDANTSDNAKVLLSVILVVINTFLMVVILFTVFVYGDKYVVAKLKFLDVTDIPGNPFFRMILLAYILQRHVQTVVTATMHRTFQRTPSKRQKRNQPTGVTQMTALAASRIPGSTSKNSSSPRNDTDSVVEVRTESESHL